MFSLRLRWFTSSRPYAASSAITRSGGGCTRRRALARDRVYDAGGGFVGTFDPRLDSLRDVNYTDAAITIGDYVANPDHKSIPVREVPDHYWQCLVYHEDRNLGGVLNPFGIDLRASSDPASRCAGLAAQRLNLGVGGRRLPCNSCASSTRRRPASRAAGQAERPASGAGPVSTASSPRAETIPP
jgi:hypothetical protein